MSKKVLLLSGDGIGPDIMREAEKVLEALREDELDVMVKRMWLSDD